MQQGKAFFVVGDVIPLIPNDVLTVLAGMSGYSFIFVFVVTLITRAICIATTVWMFGYMTRYPWLIACLVVLLVFMLFAAIFVTKRSIKKNKAKKDKTNTDQCPYEIEKELPTDY